MRLGRSKIAEMNCSGSREVFPDDEVHHLDDKLNESTLLLAVEAHQNLKETFGPALVQGIRRHEILAIELLKRGVDPDSKDSYGPALTQAIRGGGLKLIRKLLELGASPNANDSYGPALTQGIRTRNETLAIELLERGADANTKDSYGPALTQADYLQWTWNIIQTTKW